jgi:hypothetical protein
MSNKTKELSRKEKEAIEESRKATLKSDYEIYVNRITARKEAGEEIEVKPYEKWVRKAKRTDTAGIESEIEVAGDSGETGKERFKRLADKRVSSALKKLDLIMNLSASQYEPYDTEKIINALRLKVLDIENSFKVTAKEEKPVFTL